jgi:cytochrome bd-type quinol oxidase subunit 2
MSFIAMRDTDLEGVVVESSDQYASAALELLFENLEQCVAVCQALFWVSHDSLWISNCFVEELDLAAASVARLEISRWKDAMCQPYDQPRRSTKQNHCAGRSQQILR